MASRTSKRSFSGRTQSPPSAPTAPPLGLVMRFTPGAAQTGIRQIEKSGLKVATSSDFRTAKSVPNNLGGAEVQYFERLGIAIVRSRSEQVSAMVRAARENRTIQNARPEIRYRPLGMRPARIDHDQPTAQAVMPLLSLDPAYLQGYRDGMNQIIDALLAKSAANMEASAAAFVDGTSTWGLQAIRVPQSSLSGKGIKVAILDTGFDDRHSDFAGRKVTKKLFATNSLPDDTHGHGTHCVGTSCGPHAPTGVPRYGIAHEAEIFVGKVLGDDGFGTDRSIIAGIEWALEQECSIISMSLGAATNIGDAANADYEQIGQVCLDSGTLIVAAAGNESDRPGLIAPVGSPANAKTILAVAAVDPRLRIAPFSCGGLNSGQDVDVAAPGVDVLSSAPGGGHVKMSGTSMATPHVAGLAALLAQSDPRLRGQALWDRLLHTCRNLSLPPRDVGRGLIQI